MSGYRVDAVGRNMPLERSTRSDKGKKRSPSKNSPWALWKPKSRPALTPTHGWLAGIIDGEGSYKYRDGRPNELVVAMCDRKSVERCREIAGCGSLKQRATKNKPLWVWRICSDDMREISWLLLPVLITKWSQARDAVEGGDSRGID